MNKIVIDSEDGTPANTHVSLEDGTELGTVQGISWKLQVGELATCNIETVLTPARLQALQEQTHMTFSLDDPSLYKILHDCYDAVKSDARNAQLTETLASLLY